MQVSASSLRVPAEIRARVQRAIADLRVSVLPRTENYREAMHGRDAGRCYRLGRRLCVRRLSGSSGPALFHVLGGPSLSDADKGNPHGAVVRCVCLRSRGHPLAR
jgi:hypothetical protein